jgi:hypothetical protein
MPRIDEHAITDAAGCAPDDAPRPVVPAPVVVVTDSERETPAQEPSNGR